MYISGMPLFRGREKVPGPRSTLGKSIVTQREPQGQHSVDKSDPLIKVGDYEFNQRGDN